MSSALWRSSRHPPESARGVDLNSCPPALRTSPPLSLSNSVQRNSCSQKQKTPPSLSRYFLFIATTIHILKHFPLRILKQCSESARIFFCPYFNEMSTWSADLKLTNISFIKVTQDGVEALNSDSVLALEM